VQQDAVLSLFRSVGALLEGHFRLSSGLHSNGYMQSALVLQHPDHAAALGRALADAVRALDPHVVLSPALGGLIIGHEVARALGVRAIFAERVDGVLTLRRGFSLAAAERVLVVEDVVTTGKSTRETIAVAEAAGATVVERRRDHQPRRRRGVPLHGPGDGVVPDLARRPDPAGCCRSVTKPGSRRVQ
jgi:orotate phosphoribosyltransferase